MFDIATPTVGLFAIIGGIIYFESRKRIRSCTHQHTVCIHGDAILARMKVYTFRWWKPEVIRRQSCLDCGKAIDRMAICTATGEEQHYWEGPWPNHFIMGEFDGTG